MLLISPPYHYYKTNIVRIVNSKLNKRKILFHFYFIFYLGLRVKVSLSTSNATVLTNRKTITNSGGIAKQMKKQTPLNLKQRKENHAHTCSSVQTVRETTKLTQISIHSGGIGSTENGNKRNILRSMKTGSSQFALWGVVNFNNDFAKPQNIFTKCLK